MRALKFLAHGAIGPYSKFRWPRPTSKDAGAWVIAASSISLCAHGIHACHVDDLSYLSSWLADELWIIELAGEIKKDHRKIVAERGRLVQQIEAWNRAVFAEFAQSAIFRARDRIIKLVRGSTNDEIAQMLVETQDVSDIGKALAGRGTGTEAAELALGYLSDAVNFWEKEPAVAAFCAAHTTLSEDGFWAERAYQSTWIAQRLDLARVMNSSP